MWFFNKKKDFSEEIENFLSKLSLRLVDIEGRMLSLEKQFQVIRSKGRQKIQKEEEEEKNSAYNDPFDDIRKINKELGL